MADLFISAAHEDEARIRPLVYALEQYGWSVFWDRRIPAGQTWRSYISQALIDASCVIVAWSRHSIVSRWVVEEADEGQKRGILIPVLLDSVELLIGFRSIQAADMTDWQPGRPSPSLEQLARDINAVLVITSRSAATEQAAEPKAETHGQPSALPQRQPKVPSRRLAYALLAMILVLVAGGSYWGYQKWLSKPTVSLPSTTAARGIIYVHKDRADNTSAAEDIVKQLMEASFPVEKTVGKMDSSQVPKIAEVRYFNEDDKDQATRVADILKKSFSNAKLVRSRLPAPKGQLEVWLPQVGN
jgi:TIR domain